MVVEWLVVEVVSRDILLGRGLNHNRSVGGAYLYVFSLWWLKCLWSAEMPKLWLSCDFRD